MKSKILNTGILFMLILLLVLLQGLPGYAQNSDKIISLGEKFSLQSKILNEGRSMLVYLPDDYQRVEKKFPVIYVLDGNENFKHVCGAVNFLSSRGYIPSSLVVAIINVDRTRDFSPTHIEQVPTSGGAELFHQFLNKELIPYIDNTYKASSYRVLVGHSFGGTFATYSLLEHTDVFNSYIAISPFLMWDENVMLNTAINELPKKFRDHKVFFMTLGNEPNYFSTIDEFVALINEKNPRNLSFHYRFLKEENHTSIPYLSTYYGLQAIFSEWQLPDAIMKKGLTAIDKHYNNLSEQMGYEIKTPERVLNTLGYTYLNQNKVNKAIEVFTENVRRFPLSANVYDSLGEAYEKIGKIKLAIENYEIAVGLGKGGNHLNLQVFEKNLERVKKTLTDQ